MKLEDKISLAEKMAVSMLKELEGFRAEPYLCPGGYTTIGYGHRIISDEYKKPISEKLAEIILENDVARFSAIITSSLKEKTDELSENQLAALISFVFNIGVSAFKSSTVRKKILEGAPAQEIADEMKRWVYVNGKILPGLIERRKAEAELFLSGKTRRKN